MRVEQATTEQDVFQRLKELHQQCATDASPIVIWESRVALLQPFFEKPECTTLDLKNMLSGGLHPLAMNPFAGNVLSVNSKWLNSPELGAEATRAAYYDLLIWEHCNQTLDIDNELPHYQLASKYIAETWDDFVRVFTDTKVSGFVKYMLLGSFDGSLDYASEASSIKIWQSNANPEFTQNVIDTYIAAWEEPLLRISIADFMFHFFNKYSFEQHLLTLLEQGKEPMTGYFKRKLMELSQAPLPWIANFNTDFTEGEGAAHPIDRVQDFATRELLTTLAHEL